MNKHFGVNWGIAVTVIAVLEVLVWQALSTFESTYKKCLREE